MISKNKKLFLKIYILFVIIISIALIILQILGSKNRIGYLTDFNLEIDRTLELNNLNDIREEFTIAGELDEENIKNYLLTNENITNYVHHFRIRYYDKTFRNNDIYGVYPDLSNLPDYMENVEMDGDGSPYGNFISDKKEISEEKIDNINYTLRIKPKIPILLYFILVLILIIYFYNDIHKFTIKTNIYRKYDNFFTEKRFIILIVIFSLILFIFQFWLGFPGYFQNVDNYLIMDQSINGITNNVHPVIIALSLRFLYVLFGYHSFYIFLINLICWYSGLSLLIIGLYIHFNKRLVILLFILSYIGNIFFQNFFQLKDVTTSMYLWLASSIMFFITVLNTNKKSIKIIIYSIIILLLLLATLWRHNAIVSVYPLFIFIMFMFLNNKEYKNHKKYITIFVSYMLLVAILLVVLVKVFPYIILSDKDNTAFPTDIIYMLDVVACAVLSNDDKLIPDDWYINGSNFENIKEKYNKNPLWIDYMFVNISPKNVKQKWKEAVLKYPFHYLKQKWLMFKGYTIGFVGYIYNSSTISGVADYHNSNIDILKDINNRVLPYFNDNEQSIQFSKIRKSIYDILFNYLIQIKHIFFFVVSLIIFLISLYIIIFKNERLSSMLILSFSLSSSSLATTLIVVFVTISCDVRYIYPIVPTSIISSISFLTFIHQSGGFKKFIKELKGDNKK